jgi:hypothetical protein
VWSALLACLLAALAALSVAGSGPAHAQTSADPAATAARHVVVVGISGLRWSDVSATATPTLWRLAGRLRGAAADLPGRRLADAERGRQGAVRSHRRQLRRVPRRGRLRRRRPGPRPARAGVLQQPVPQHPQLGPAVPRVPWLLHRRRPGRRAGPGRQLRPRRLLPAVPWKYHRRGAVPLPADRRGPGKSRIGRTGPGACLRGLRTRPDRGGPAGRHHAA